MKKLLLTTVASALVLASSASYANDDMPRTRAEAIKHHQAKVDKLKSMTDQQYLDWKKTKASKKSRGTGHTDHDFKSDNTDVGTTEESENTKHNATAK